MAIANLDKVRARKTGNLSAVVFDQAATNGMVFHLGELVDGERELHKAVKPTTASIDVEPLVLHASVEMSYDPRQSGLKSFVLAQGEEGRGVHLSEGDIFTLTEDCFSAAPTVKQLVVPQNNSYLLAPAATMGTTKFVGRVIEKTLLGFDGQVAYAIQVVRN